MTNSFPHLQLWGKAARRDASDWHPLAYHMLDVAAVAEEVLEREPERTRQLYAEDYCLSWEDAKRWILFFVGLHDLGKATPAFQYKVEERLPQLEKINLTIGKNTLLRWKTKSPISHGELSVKLLKETLLNYGWKFEAAKLIAEAVGIHHGHRTNANKLRGISLEEEGEANWLEIRNVLIQSLLDVFQVNLDSIPALESLHPGGFMRLAGLACFSDWIGSNTDYFKYDRSSDKSLSEYYANARIEKVKTALDSIGWHNRVSLQKTTIKFEDVFSFPPRPLQSLMATIVDNVKKPILILIEAPMGEGKTEAALYAHLRLQEQLQHRGLYVALPTQATGNSMFRRVSEFLESMKHPHPLDLQLLHGASFLNDNFTKLKMRGIYSTNSKSANVLAEEWFTHKKRALLSDYGVGTVDQALLSVMNVKHQFVRIWGLGNRIIVLDEIHAYDMYTSTLIEALIEWFFALGSSVILMSATLPKNKKDSLLRSFGAENMNYAEYPRITYLNNGETESHSISIPKNPDRKMELQLKSAPTDINDLSDLLLKLVGDGGCAVCIVNTVQRAQDIYSCLSEMKSSDIELFLFHARFPAEERTGKENDILKNFGKDSFEQRPKKAILIATQVVEQSLDIDFDVMVSDLAPIDLILQRAGRLHRHKRENRFSHSIPTLYISGLNIQIGSLGFGKPLYWDYVYERHILLKTWWILQNETTIHLPDEIDSLVETVYGETLEFKVPKELLNELEKSKEKMNKTSDEDKSNAIHTVIGSPFDGSWKTPPQLKQEEDDDLNVHPLFIAKTRKGDRSITVIPIFQKENKIHLDYKTEIDFISEIQSDLAKKIFMRSLNLSRKDIVKEISNKKIPENWKENALLRNCYPLILENNKTTIGSLEISYHKELGIVYKSNT
ncbi:CRISPR-associated helicase Cas3 [Leptospira weilii serovar Ranarum str. ICFT]|uniref:CRISPR-associated helicase Cas3 n=1 Tax=Leptospira weilii serovar Ranarum str. ICFT TaxID=1218598 RepID=N1WD13_9LEPT|nr:CRISPR-associated helicase/endonuclease Cas3 [Leptospira weilii]EMY78151.1 CRISPR-associated helicase Cas3 [Leptospira weilii serovar Ranarum str. ICFT]